MDDAGPSAAGDGEQGGGAGQVPWQARVSAHVDALIRAQAAQLEDDCAAAMTLQDFDHLERLVVIVDPPSGSSSVASLLGNAPTAPTWR